MTTTMLAALPRRRCRTLPIAFALFAALAASPPSAARDTLTLRVNDAIAEPSGLAAVVIRTYASKPISQGQVCFRLRRSRKAAARPFTAIEDVKVFARRGDGLSVAAMDVVGGGQTIIVEFSSASRTINQNDGPLAVIYFRVSSAVSPGDRYQIAIDTANTALVDAGGQPVKLAPRAGELLIRHPADPHLAAADDDKIAPGERAELGVETFEPVAMRSGQIGFTYDPAIAAGRPKVRMSRKHGKRRFRVDSGIPGLIVVTFRSPNASFNRVPGQIVSINLPTSRSVARGTRSPITLDPSLSFFADPAGNLLPFDFEGGAIRFEGGDGGNGDDDGDDDDDGNSGGGDDSGGDSGGGGNSGSGSGDDDDEGGNSGGGSDDDDRGDDCDEGGSGSSGSGSGSSGSGNSGSGGGDSESCDEDSDDDSG